MKLRTWSTAVLPWIVAAGVTHAEVAPSEPLFVERAKLLASDGGLADAFGANVAIDGDVIVVGGDEFGVGGAYVFERSRSGPNRWGEVVKLTAPSGVPDDDFGQRVAIEGDIVAAREVVADPQGSGALYLFSRDAGGPGEWGLIKHLTAPEGPEPGQAFGVPALSGDTLLAGTAGDDDGAFDAGAVYVYERNAGGPDNWGVVAKLTASDPDGSAFFGLRLAIDGDVLVVGTAKEAAYVFQRDGSGTWHEVKKLTPSDGAPFDRFGQAVAIEGDVIAVGAEWHDAGGFDTGAVYVFERDHGGVDNWGEVIKLVHDDAIGGDVLGISVAIDGGRLVAGATGVDENGIEATGAVFVFERDESGAWEQRAKILAADGDELDLLGWSVALSGSTLIGGAPSEDERAFGAGAAYVFQMIATPKFAVSGSCPGEVRLTLSEATPRGVVAVARALGGGTSIVPSGVCEGVQLDLEDPEFLSSFVADSSGSKTMQRRVPAQPCADMLQAIDMTTCGTSAVLQVNPRTGRGKREHP